MLVRRPARKGFSVSNMAYDRGAGAFEKPESKSRRYVVTWSSLPHPRRSGSLCRILLGRDFVKKEPSLCLPLEEQETHSVNMMNPIKPSAYES